MRKLILTGGYLIGAVITLIGWWQNSGILLSGDAASVWLAIGRLAGLFGFYHLLWQFLLIGRLPLFDRLVGFDRLARWHHWNAAAALVFIIIHPFTIALAYGSLGGISWWHQWGLFALAGDDMVSAFAGLALLLVVALSSWLARFIIRSYERWYVIHLAAYAGVLLSFSHQLEFGGDFRQFWFALWWQAITGAAVALFVGYRFVLPLWQFWRYRFSVAEVITEGSGVVSISITGRHLERFHFQPGQFGLFRFFGPRVWAEAHPFSFSCTPGKSSMRITAKAVGDFTAGLPATIRPGMPVFIDGPHGNFVLPSAARPVLLVAGGIGVTPIRSLAERAVQRGLDTVVVYSTRQSGERIFETEFNQLGAAGRMRFIPHVTATAGHLTASEVQRQVPDLRQRDIFICGPQAMNQLLCRQFRALGVPASHLHWEQFSFRSMRPQQPEPVAAPQPS